MGHSLCAADADLVQAQLHLRQLCSGSAQQILVAGWAICGAAVAPVTALLSCESLTRNHNLGLAVMGAHLQVGLSRVWSAVVTGHWSTADGVH